MSHPYDPSRDTPGPASDPRGFDDRRPGGDHVPAPDPAASAEPISPDRGSFWPSPEQPAQAPPAIEPSWRTLVGRREGAGWPDRQAPDGKDPNGGADTTIGTLGEEPMGGAPREDAQTQEAPAPRPGSTSTERVTLGRVAEELFAWLKTLASAAVYATLIVTFGFQVARVEGQSMAPTLENQDRLIVNKLAYRIGNPQVGDIVMLYYPLNPDKSFVKRVIAEEGDQIRIVDGKVYRNDVPINDDYVPAEYRGHDDYGPEVIPQGYYFVMGDHRNNSSDSRHWKWVPKKYIIGKVQLRWWPIPAARVF